MDFLNVNSNLIKNFNSTIKSEENNKVKAKVLFANKDSLIVNYRGKVILLENKSNVPLKPGMIIYLSFDQVQNNSKNQILTKALGQIVENMFNLSLMINDSPMNFDIELTNIPDNKKASFIKWLSDFFTTLDKNIPEKPANSVPSLSNDKIKFILKNIIEDIGKNFTKNKSINPDPIQFAKNIAKKLFSYFQNKTSTNTYKNISNENIFQKNNFTTSKNNLNEKKNFSKNQTSEIKPNIIDQKKVNSSSNKTINNIQNIKEFNRELSKKSNDEMIKNNYTNKPLNNKKIITLLKTDSSNNDKILRTNNLKNIFDNFIKSNDKSKNIFLISNSKNFNKTYIDSLTKFLMNFQDKNEKIFLNKSNFLLQSKNNKPSIKPLIPKQKPNFILNINPKIILKTTIKNEPFLLKNLNGKNPIIKSDKPINKIFVNFENFTKSEKVEYSIKEFFQKLSKNIQKQNITTKNMKNIIVIRAEIPNQLAKPIKNNFNLLFNHDTLINIDKNIKEIVDSISQKDNSSSNQNNVLFNNVIDKAISAYQNMEGMKNISDTSYMMFNMFGLPVYLSFNKEEIVQNENKKSSKTYGKIRLILPTESFGVTDINLFVNERDAFVNIKMQKNTEIFETEIEKLKKNIESHNINLNSLSIKQDTELINIEKEISVS